MRHFAGILIAAALAAMAAFASAHADNAHSEPWRDPSRALVLDAYEYNELDWPLIVSDKRIAGFIGKATDGLPTEYSCRGKATAMELHLCKLAWRRYAMSKELYHTRKALAKALGLKWGAYHLARAGNPVEQADHFLDFAKPEADDLIALDIEENDPREFLSLEDAEIFARHIHARTGRWPILYTNGSTARHIARNTAQYPLLSRLKLWYARYKPEIGDHFPKGNWQSYTLWQFVSHINCSERTCPYRVPGTNRDIDVNVAMMGVDELRRQWPFDGLVPEIANPVVAEDERAAPEIAAAEQPVPQPPAMMLAFVPVPAQNPKRAGASASASAAIDALMVPVTRVRVPQPAPASPPQPAIASASAAPSTITALQARLVSGYRESLSRLASLNLPDRTIQTGALPVPAPAPVKPAPKVRVHAATSHGRLSTDLASLVDPIQRNGAALLVARVAGTLEDRCRRDDRLPALASLAAFGGQPPAVSRAPARQPMSRL